MAKPKKVKRWINVVIEDTNVTGGKRIEPVQIDAYVLPGIKNLFINQDTSNSIKQKQGWAITHRPSGLIIHSKRRFKDPKLAVKVLEEVADYADWSMNAKQLQKHFPLVVSLVDEFIETLPKKGLISDPTRSFTETKGKVQRKKIRSPVKRTKKRKRRRTKDGI